MKIAIVLTLSLFSFSTWAGPTIQNLNLKKQNITSYDSIQNRLEKLAGYKFDQELSEKLADSIAQTEAMQSENSLITVADKESTLVILFCVGTKFGLEQGQLGKNKLNAEQEFSLIPDPSLQGAICIDRKDQNYLVYGKSVGNGGGGAAVFVGTIWAEVKDGDITGSYFGTQAGAALVMGFSAGRYLKIGSTTTTASNQLNIVNFTALGLELDHSNTEIVVERIDLSTK